MKEEGKPSFRVLPSALVVPFGDMRLCVWLDHFTCRVGGLLLNPSGHGYHLGRSIAIRESIMRVAGGEG